MSFFFFCYKIKFSINIFLLNKNNLKIMIKFNIFSFNPKYKLNAEEFT